MSRTPLDVLRELGPTFRARDARDQGLHWRDLYALRDAGSVIELSRGLYRLADADPATGLDLLAVSRRAPHGTICLLSALVHWDLTDERPGLVELAVPRGGGRPSIAYPPTRVHVFDRRTFELGRTRVAITPGEDIAISSAERTIVDMFRLRGRLGADLANSALRQYLRTTGARPGEVIGMAEKLRVGGPVRSAVQVLLA